MYSGSDSAESQTYPQWALNPQNFQNMSSDQVDWAALAQQWIIMKEAGPPPLPGSQTPPKNQKKDVGLNEGGEAPMEVENDKDEGMQPQWDTAPPPPGTDAWSWNAQSQTWGWNNAWVPPSGVPPPIPLKAPLLPTPGFNQFNAPPDSGNDNANVFGSFNANTPNSDYATGYWTSAGSSKQLKPHNRRFSKVNVPRPLQPSVIDPHPTLDAAKRKQLPAWIREGLEKMEKDKQKQLEKEKEKLEREEYNEKIKQNEKETMELLKNTIKEQQKSKFESDGEVSDDEPKVIRAEPVPLTPEEQIMKVRRTMTEILLKVTNREIENICREELQRHYKKFKASDQRVSAPSGANVSARLGLGIYGGDSGSSNEESEDDQKDSDLELRDSIKRKKAEFSKTEKEIKEKLIEAENIKRNRTSTTSSPAPDNNDNETQVDAKISGRKHRTDDKSHKHKSRSLSRSSSSESDHNKNTKKRSSRRSSPSSSSGGRSSSTGGGGGNNGGGGVDGRKTPPLIDNKRYHHHHHHNKNFQSKRSRSRSIQRNNKRSRSTSRRNYSRKRTRSRSSSYHRRRRSRSRSRNRRSRSRSRRSRSRSHRHRSRSRSSRRRRSRSSSGGGGGGRKKRRR